MFLERDLTEGGFVEPEAMQQALERQLAMGEPLCQSLLMSNAINFATLDNVLGYHIKTLHKAADTGVERTFLMNLMIKIMFVQGLETIAQLVDVIKLPYAVVEELMEMGRDRTFVESMGSGGGSLIADFRYGLSRAGADLATSLLRQSEYAGPAPVPLDDFTKQVKAQSISNDRVSRERLVQCLSHLVVDDATIDKFGPGMNSGQAMMVYGPVGNGKTSLALALASAFENYVYIPHAIEVDGQIINVFDPTVHEEMQITEDPIEGQQAEKTIFKSSIDNRWVRCKRPVVVAGGELTMEMLDLKFDQQLRYCEAPLQLKAVSGVFIIDDFGRQSVRPEDILNRWIYPLERGHDFLTLPTGKKFAVPFDTMFIISTNQSPGELIDGAMLRRIPYKFHIMPPSLDELKAIFKAVCEKRELPYEPKWVDLLIEEFYNRYEVPFARFHVSYMLDQVSARCRYENVPMHITRDMLLEAANHLIVRE